MNKKIMLHHLRNPYGVDDIEMREARLQAANELKRLYELEEKIKTHLLNLKSLKDLFDESN